MEIRNIEEIGRTTLILHYTQKIRDEALRKAFKETAVQLAENKDIAELYNGIVNGTITL